MKAERRVQYTIRSVPQSVDRALRGIARDTHKSLNAVLLEIVTRATGANVDTKIHDDLDHLIGTWVADPETERVLSEQRKVHPGDWQ